ncbi:hypothetical protein SAMN05428950_101426 [Sphingomonas sp. OV641]|jgi:predicted phosphate transport protein (TIGR00153 family)|uniref:DUF47 domain-containing protein n=1 Tax=unclassified Sphingomonas TaxID=196159 RepID=UPI0008336BA1|nr:MULTISPECIES: DUF47 family protein [unclassified Sphingomonas]SEI86795.1 hypothetical protein SAMN05428950_101426 [Sphingomonas sp. OV641]
MFAWFQRLLPKRGNFFELFDAHAAVTLRAAEATTRLFAGDTNPEKIIAEVKDLEHQADEITRTVLQTVRITFLTPFDRSAISDLIGSMDDAIDAMDAALTAVSLYGVRSFTPDMHQMASSMTEAAAVTVEAMQLLRDVARNGPRIHQLTERLVQLEGEADAMHERGLKRLFEHYHGGDAMQFVVEREIYKHLEKISDAFEDVANEIDGIVIDHA